MSKRLKRQLKQILIGLSIFAVLMVVEHTCGFSGDFGYPVGRVDAVFNSVSDCR